MFQVAFMGLSIVFMGFGIWKQPISTPMNSTHPIPWTLPDPTAMKTSWVRWCNWVLVIFTGVRSGSVQGLGPGGLFMRVGIDGFHRSFGSDVVHGYWAWVRWWSRGLSEMCQMAFMGVTVGYIVFIGFGLGQARAQPRGRFGRKSLPYLSHFSLSWAEGEV